MSDRTLDMERIFKQTEENCLMRRIMICTSLRLVEETMGNKMGKAWDFTGNK
jgi:hypothetical protein